MTLAENEPSLVQFSVALVSRRTRRLHKESNYNFWCFNCAAKKKLNILKKKKVFCS
jgi:hypothetical protein